MLWTSINKKLSHFVKIILSYITYESNIYMIIFNFKAAALLILTLVWISVI